MLTGFFKSDAPSKHGCPLLKHWMMVPSLPSFFKGKTHGLRDLMISSVSNWVHASKI